jgi:hypothetical protein
MSQGNRFSGMERKFMAGTSSLVTRLASRSVTGRGMPLQVHQHWGYDLLLTWEYDRRGVPTEACVRRRFFCEADINEFCRDLIDGSTSGLCSCVFAEPMSEHVPLCPHTNRTEPTKWLAADHCRFCFCLFIDCRCRFGCPIRFLVWRRQRQRLTHQ